MAQPQQPHGPKQLKKLPLLEHDIECDDEGAVLVVVFPKYVEGASEPKEDWDTAWKEIFLGKTGKTYVESTPCYKKLQQNKGATTKGAYHELIRQAFFAMWFESTPGKVGKHDLTPQDGEVVSTVFESIDGDEIFYTFDLKDQGFGRVADIVGWPVQMEENKQTEYVTQYCPGFPQKNDCNERVPIYLAFGEDTKEYLGDFSELDKIFLLQRALGSVNLEQMASQEVIKAAFVAANYEVMTELSKSWANFRNIACIPSDADVHSIEKYFGPRIGFFYLWFGSYTRALAGLSFIVVVMLASHYSADMLQDRQPTFHYLSQYLPNVYIILLVGWACLFNALFKRSSSRFQQHWGMKDSSSRSPVLPEYDVKLEGTKMLAFKVKCAQLFTGAYMAAFVGAVCMVNAVGMKMRSEGDMSFAPIEPIILSVIMKVFGGVWNAIVSKLVTWENHRTRGEFDNSLAYKLASVNLFVALYPFFNIAFFKKFNGKLCGATLADAALKVYSPVGAWPKGTGMASFPLVGEVDKNKMAPLLEEWLTPFASDLGSKVCISGCYPVSCVLHDNGVYTCENFCRTTLQSQLMTFFPIFAVSAAVAVLIPIILTKIAINAEVNKPRGSKAVANVGLKWLQQPVQELVAVSTDGADEKTSLLQAVHVDGSTPGHASVAGPPVYSLLQYQAKTAGVAPYQFGANGGSYNEDFLTVSISYSLLACFSLASPTVVIFGFFCILVLFRLFAFRMLFVTCRPWPTMIDGIGVWTDIFDRITSLAVTVNVAQLAFLEYPCNTWEAQWQFAAFIALEKILFMISDAIGTVMPVEPRLVGVIHYLNRQISAAFD